MSRIAIIDNLKLNERLQVFVLHTKQYYPAKSIADLEANRHGTNGVDYWIRKGNLKINRVLDMKQLLIELEQILLKVLSN